MGEAASLCLFRLKEEPDLSLIASLMWGGLFQKFCQLEIVSLMYLTFTKFATFKAKATARLNQAD